MRGILRVLPLASAFACSTLVGADFDDLEVAPPAGRGGAAQGGGGKGGAVGNGGDGATTASAGDDAGGAAGSESPSGGSPPAVGGAAAGQGSGGTPAEGGAGGSSGTPAEGGAGGSGGTPHPVVLNEVKAQGNDVVDEDYLELFNTSSEEQDISGYRVADDGNVFVFPADTFIPGEGYIVILLDSALTTGGPNACPWVTDGCFHVAEWAISAGGEPVFFRDPSNQTLSYTVYPDELGPNGIENGQSWGRLPNGDGAFEATAITPGDPNTAP